LTPLSQSGRAVLFEDVAAVALLRLQPDYSLKIFEETEAVNMKPADLERDLELLREAGVPA
jgi:hypothetical protein